MVTLAALWLPILGAAVLVFAASAIAWTVSPHHKTDYGKLPNEDAVLDALRSAPLPLGQYFFPFAMGPKDLEDKEVAAKYEKGPVGVLTVMPAGLPKMGRSLVQSCLYYMVVSFLVAYVGTATMEAGTDYLRVFRVTGTVAMLAYGAGSIPNAIWFGTPWRNIWKGVFDAGIYGLLTAGMFGWLWP